MTNLFTIRDGLFDESGRQLMSNMEWFIAELSDMRDAFLAGDKEKALEHENNCSWAIYFTSHKDVINDMEYELYISPYTQLHHPRRSITVKKDD